MINRRQFLSGLLVLPALIGEACAGGNKRKSASQVAKDTIRQENQQGVSQFIFNNVIKKARAEKWDKLPIGQMMGNIGLLFLGTPYTAGTLEGDGEEVCRVDLSSLDCVTFFETALGIARILKKGKYGYNDLVNEITTTRYRSGVVSGYVSRLHYTSDWLYDNTRKQVVKDITHEIGGEIFPLQVGFMSKNPKFYPALVSDSSLIDMIARVEKEINSRDYWFIPKDKVSLVEPKLQTGDIIAISTNKEGLDYSHTGMAYRDENGLLRFLHASQTKKKVILDDQLSKYLAPNKAQTGISVARPIEI